MRRFSAAALFLCLFVCSAFAQTFGPPQAYGIAISSRPLIATIGDSRLDTNTGNTTPASPQANSILAWAQFFTGGAFEHGPALNLNFATGGWTTAQALASLPAVLARNPDAVALFVSTNSTSAGVSADAQKLDLDRIVNGVLGANKLLIIFSENPRTGYTGSLLTTHLALAEHLRRYGSRPNVIIIDPWTYSGDPTSATGDPKANYTLDGLHQNSYLAMVLGRGLATQLVKRLPSANILPASNADVYDASVNTIGNLVSNPMLAGTAGSKGTGVTGSVADGWSVSTSDTAALLVVASKTTDAAGRPVQRLVVDGTPTSTNPVISITQNITVGNLSVGDRLSLGWECGLAAGHTGFIGLSSTIIPAGSSALRQYAQYSEATQVSMINGEVIGPGVSVAPTYPVPNPVPASLGAYMRVWFKQNEVGHAQIDCYRVGFRKVN